MAGKKKPTDPQSADAYYKALLDSKVAAGLPLATAMEVTANQRREDDANPEFVIPESEPLPE